jgi:general secretion pathway protein M
MKERWLSLNVREQRLIMAMGSVILFFILYSVIWKPLNNNIEKATSKVARYQKLQTWVQTETSRYKSIAGSGGKASSKGSLSSVVNKTAGRNLISIARTQPQADDLQVWIEEVPFNQLLTWLEQLSNRENIKVKSIDLTNTDQTGVVKVRRLQLGRS